MTPEVLGNLTALAQKTQQANQNALKAQQMALNASKSSTSGSATAAAGPGWNQIRNATPMAGVHGVLTSWTPLSIGSTVPQSALWILISGYAYFSTPDNADVELDFRSDAGGAVFVACRYRSVSGTYSGNAAINVWVPVGPSGTIQYQIQNGSYSTLSLSIVAWA